jgi:hypothetical protein
MSLKNDTFGFSRYWLMTALDKLPVQPELFARKSLSASRKAFLAGDNQLKAIKNWLSHAGLVEASRGSTNLTELGRLIAAKDPAAEQAWTWWLFHLHLCADADSFPYSAFFTRFDAEGTSWVSFSEIVDKLHQCQPDLSSAVERSTVENYFEGVERTFRAGTPIHALGLVERRLPINGDGGERFRRCLATPADLVVAYATLLFHNQNFAAEQTVETRRLLEKGLARSLGIRDQQLRDTLSRIHQHHDLGQFVQFRRAVNLDSVQFARSGEPALRSLRMLGYDSGEVRWP